MNTAAGPRILGRSYWAQRAADVAMLGVGLLGLWLFGRIESAGDAAILLGLSGFMLVLGVYAGRCSEHLHVPHITGFILIGAICGPEALALVGEHQVAIVNLVSHIAIGLIALMAGAEIRLSWLRQRFAGFCALVGLQALVVPLAILAAVLLLAALGAIPELAAAVAASPVPLVLVGLLVGAVALANSPMVVVSIIKGMGSKGPVSETAMGVSVLKDLAVLLGFTLLLAICTRLQSAQAGDVASMLLGVGGNTIAAILSSILVGLLIGQGLRFYTNRSKHRLPWVLVGLSLVIAAAEQPLHIEPLFCLLAAGFSAENIGRRTEKGTHRLEQGLGRVAEPIFVLFFVGAGLKLKLGALWAFLPAVLVLVSVRMVAKWMSMQIACRLTGQELPVRKYAWTALVPQAGVTLSLAAIIESQFELTWGPQVATLLVAMVAVHELLGPLLFIAGLKRSGETRVLPAAPARVAS